MTNETMIERKLGEGRRVRVKILKENMIRIQIVPDEFTDSGLNRYGFIKEPVFPDLSVTKEETVEGITAKTSQLVVTCIGNQPVITIADNQGNTLLQQVGFAFHKQGAVARFKAHPEEDWIGFGDQTRERLYHRGHTADCHVRNVKSYITVPFFMSTRGVGVLVNTTHRTVFDMCKSDPDHFEWRDGRGAVDYYVMVGTSFRDLIKLYTDLTGRPKLPPEWAFGLWYICRTQANDYETVNDARQFRQANIPCDVIGLEPGWMEKCYDESLDKEWSKERFPIPPYAPIGPHNFFNAIKRMNFHMELWLCCDYDLSYEAERRIGAEDRQESKDDMPAFFQSDAEHDEHFSAPRYMDTITKKDEAWFRHLKKFVDQGADFFKQDGAYQVLDHPDRLWGNGMRDNEMHNLYPLLYARQMHEGFEEYTGRRAVTFTPAGWTGFQAWAGTWTGDTGGRLPTLGAMLNTAIIGHSWMTNDMEVAEKEGIHFGYLLPWSQINSFNYFRMPWIQGPELFKMHKAYSHLRSRLLPYIYSWAFQATQTGFPLLAPLTLEFRDDPNCREVMHQYLLGRDLMVSIYKPEVYFPDGRWKNYWTGEVTEGRKLETVSWPPDRGGGLFVRAGAIIPFGPVMQFRKEKPVDPIELYVFPDAKESSFNLYEDDGVSLEHKQGRFAITAITARSGSAGITVNIGKTKGRFEGQTVARRWAFRIAADFAPAKVTAGGTVLENSQWKFDHNRQEVIIEPLQCPVDLMVSKASC